MTSPRFSPHRKDRQKSLEALRARAIEKFGPGVFDLPPATPVGPPQRLEPRVSSYPCPTIRMPDRLEAQQEKSTFDRDLNDNYDWNRKCFQVNELDFEGDFKDGRKRIKMQKRVLIDGETNEKLMYLLDAITGTLFGLKGNVSFSLLLDILVRWFIQHPPSNGWIKGYLVRWWSIRIRGSPQVQMTDEYQRGEWARQGFNTPEEFEAFKADRKKAFKRHCRVKMDECDLEYSDITIIDEENIVDGRLKIPKIPPPEKTGPR